MGLTEDSIFRINREIPLVQNTPELQIPIFNYMCFIVIGTKTPQHEKDTIPTLPLSKLMLFQWSLHKLTNSEKLGSTNYTSLTIHLTHCEVHWFSSSPSLPSLYCSPSLLPMLWRDLATHSRPAYGYRFLIHFLVFIPLPDHTHCHYYNQHSISDCNSNSVSTWLKTLQ